LFRSGRPTPANPPAGGTATTPAPANPAQTPPAQNPPAPQPPADPQTEIKPTSYLTSGNQLTVFFYGVTCDKFGLTADEGRSGTVRVQVVITQHLPVGRMCPALVKQQSVVATLGQPLNGRAVLDATTGANVPLESVPNGGPVSAGN
ncbi:hypothetical protein ACQRUO_33255, partial [Kitasatospora sp. LaBMicrA B282]